MAIIRQGVGPGVARCWLQDADLAAQVAEEGVQLRAEQGDATDDRDGDERDEQRVLGRGRATVGVAQVGGAELDGDDELEELVHFGFPFWICVRPVPPWR